MVSQCESVVLMGFITVGIFRRGRIVAHIKKENTCSQHCVAAFTAAKTGAEYDGAA